MSFEVAVLQAFHEVKDGLGSGYLTDFERISQAVEESQSGLKLSLFDLPRLEFPDEVDKFGGILITGSPESVNRAPDYLKKVKNLVRDFDQARKRVFGICFGHQVIASSLGGCVGHMAVPWNLGLRALTPSEHVSAESKGSALWSGSYYALHNEQVLELPEGFVRLGSVRNCRNAVMAKGTHIVSSQLHPELDFNGFEAIVRHDGHVPMELVSHDAGEMSNDFGEILTNFFYR